MSAPGEFRIDPAGKCEQEISAPLVATVLCNSIKPSLQDLRLTPHTCDAQQQREPQGGPRKHVADSGIEGRPWSERKICEYPVHLIRPSGLSRNQPAVGIARGQQTMIGRARNGKSIPDASTLSGQDCRA